MFALIDCNNFFVSCERLFRPDLAERPVVVLSSNDGCVVSRSNEAKALGIPMAAPAFKWRDTFRRHGVVQFSANFELYGDISQRLTRLMTSITPRTEVYSVDESFLELDALEIGDYSAWGGQVKSQLGRDIGIPVSIGIAPTKTLAKLAADRAKKQSDTHGVLSLGQHSSAAVNECLRQTPITDVWGIGWRLGPRLKAEGIFTAFALKRLRPQHAQQLMGIHGRQLVAELNGQACHALEPFGRIRQTIMKGRMFGQDTRDFAVIESAIASLTARAALSLRKEGLCAQSASLSLSTNRHQPGYERQQRTIRLATPSADTGHLTARLVEAAQQIFRPSHAYHRANILLYDLVPQSYLQPDLLGEVDVPGAAQSQARLAAVDSLNTTYGRGTVTYAAEALSHAWEPRRGLRSPRYTTNWQELPQARILER